MALTRPIYTHPAGWRGYNFPEKLAESKFGMLWGTFWQGIRIFGLYCTFVPLRRSPTPFIPIQQGGGGTTYRQNDGKHNLYALAVLFGKEFEFLVYITHSPRHGGRPPHLYPSNRVEGGTSYRQNGGEQSMYALGVLFGKEFEFFVYIVLPPHHGGHPPHLYSSSRVEGGTIYRKNCGKYERYAVGVFFGEEFDFVVHPFWR